MNQVHAFQNQPLKALYILYELLTTLLLRIPFWVALNARPSWRARPAWSLSRVVWVQVLRRITLTTTRIGHLQRLGDHLTVAPDSLDHVWLPPAPQSALTPQMRAWASNARIAPTSIPGYWASALDTDAPTPKATVGARAAPGEKVLYMLHGGGYIRLSASPKDPIAIITHGLLAHCRRTRVRMWRGFAVEYRLSAVAAPDEPQHAFPAALLDALAGYLYLVRDVGFRAEDVVVAGDSAGGNLALALVRYLVENAGWVADGEKDEETMPPPPGGLLLFSPWADLSGSDVFAGGSPFANYDSDYLLAHNHPGALYVRTAFLGPLLSPEGLRNRYISPACDEDDEDAEEEESFAGFPRTLVVSGGAEMFRDQIRTLVRRMARDMGVGSGEGQVTHLEQPEGTHDFVGLFFHEPERTEALEASAKWIGGL